MKNYYYVCGMEKDKINEIKIKLALGGAGAKKRMAEYIGIKPPALTLFLNTGYVSEKHMKKIKKWLTLK